MIISASLQDTIGSTDDELKKHRESRGSTSDGIPALRTAVKIASDAPAQPKPKQKPSRSKGKDNSVGGKGRSGRDYYDRWDKVADELGKEEKDDSSAGPTKVEAIPSTHGAFLMFACCMQCGCTCPVLSALCRCKAVQTTVACF